MGTQNPCGASDLPVPVTKSEPHRFWRLHRIWKLLQELFGPEARLLTAGGGHVRGAHNREEECAHPVPTSRYAPVLHRAGMVNVEV